MTSVRASFDTKGKVNAYNVNDEHERGRELGGNEYGCQASYREERPESGGQVSVVAMVTLVVAVQDHLVFRVVLQNVAQLVRLFDVILLDSIRENVASMRRLEMTREIVEDRFGL